MSKLSYVGHKLFQFLNDNGETQRCVIEKKIFEFQGDPIPSNGGRGHWSRWFCYHLVKGNLKLRMDGRRAMYSITDKGRRYLDLPSKKSTVSTSPTLPTEEQKLKFQLEFFSNEINRLQCSICDYNLEEQIEIHKEIIVLLGKVKETKEKLVKSAPPHEIEFTYNETVLEKRRGVIEVPHEVYLKGERAIEEYIQQNEDDVESDMVDCEVSDTLNNISIESL